MTAPLNAPTPTPETGKPDDANKSTEENKAPESKQAPWDKNGTKFDADTAWTLIQNLQAERDAEKTKRSEYEKTLSEAEKAKLSDLEKAQAEAKENAEKAAKYEAQLLKMQVLAEKEVPANLHEFVNGSSKDELKKSADKVLAAFGNGKNGSGNPLQKTPQPGVSTGLTDSEPVVEMDPAKLAAKVKRRW